MPMSSGCMALQAWSNIGGRLSRGPMALCQSQSDRKLPPGRRHMPELSDRAIAVVSARQPPDIVGRHQGHRADAERPRAQAGDLQARVGGVGRRGEAEVGALPGRVLARAGSRSGVPQDRRPRSRSLRSWRPDRRPVAGSRRSACPWPGRCRPVRGPYGSWRPRRSRDSASRHRAPWRPSSLHCPRPRGATCDRSPRADLRRSGAGADRGPARRRGSRICGRPASRPTACGPPARRSAR